MASQISGLMDLLREDLWRSEVDFTPEVKKTLAAVLDPASQDDSIVNELNNWLARYQPCLFGRIAAKNRLISYCLLKEDDLFGSEEEIGRKIQAARLAWRRMAFEGRASGFIIVLLSKRLATASPNEAVKRIASRICSLYLQEEIQPDRICTDRLYLEQPGSRRATWEWLAGVNYFSAQGDKRWWQDHRFPAGIAFSVNSVGHMVKSGKLANAVRDLEEVMGTASGEFKLPKVDSLEKALELAMRTIALASEGPSGKATELIPLPADEPDLPRCPVQLPSFLADKNYCEYLGRYHTDFTVPSEYFLPDVKRPVKLRTHRLDFMYLFDQSLDNFDFSRMGEGEIIRAAAELAAESEELESYRYAKRLRGVETEVEINNIQGFGNTDINPS